MTNELAVKLESRGLTKDNFDIVKNILYPNVEDSTLFMVLDYCKHRHLDIMKKPVQIVPVWDSKKGKTVDTIWQSITEIRITATRTGTYAGKDEAEFGEDVTEVLSNVKITYPKWCRINVYRLVQGEKCKFSAKIFWKEAYKNAGKDSLAPNTMWKSRPYAQLEKCVEAAALRMAFPEELGSDYIIDENWHEEKPQEPKNVTPQSMPEPVKEPKHSKSEDVLSRLTLRLDGITTLTDLDAFEKEISDWLEKQTHELQQEVIFKIKQIRSLIEYENNRQADDIINAEF